MEKKRKARKCSACGGEALFVQNVELTGRQILADEWTPAALYRCPSCGHFDLYEREEEQEARARAERYRAEQAALPDYRCPACGQVGKTERCIYCGTNCLPVKGHGEPQPEKSPEPEKKKKRRWFGRDDDKPDWEG